MPHFKALILTTLDRSYLSIYIYIYIYGRMHGVLYGRMHGVQHVPILLTLCKCVAKDVRESETRSRYCLDRADNNG